MTTTKQLTAAIEATAALYRMIAARGEDGVPSGHLYAVTMGAFVDLAAYEACLGLLVSTGLVRREGLVLVAEEVPR